MKRVIIIFLALIVFSARNFLFAQDTILVMHVDSLPIPFPGDFGSDYVIYKGKKVYRLVQQLPEFPGGDRKLFDFLDKNLHFSSLPKGSATRSFVVVTFIIDSRGKIKDMKMMDEVPDTWTREVFKTLRMMPDWIPGRENGEPVSVAFDLPIRVHLQ